MADRNGTAQARWLRPRAAVADAKEGKLKVVLEMPGVRKDDLDVRIENNELMIVGRRAEQGTQKYILRERPQGSWAQSYTLDETVDQSKIDAVLEKGILTLTLDLKEHVKPRTIRIRGE
jgi:HSP20 family protein